MHSVQNEWKLVNMAGDTICVKSNLELCLRYWLADNMINIMMSVNHSIYYGNTKTLYIMFSLPLYGSHMVSYNVVSFNFCFRCVMVRIGVEWFWTGSGAPFSWVGLCAVQCWCRKKNVFYLMPIFWDATVVKATEKRNVRINWVGV